MKKINNELTLSKKEMRALELIPGTTFRQTVDVHMKGNFIQDRTGNIGFVGHADLQPSEFANAVGVGAEANLEVGTENILKGDGNMEVTMHAEINVEVPREEE